MTFLPDGTTLMVVMRLDGGDGPITHPHKPYYRTVSTDGGMVWSKAAPISAGTARPRLLRIGDAVLLSGGRVFGLPGVRDGWDVRVWLSTDPAGEVWEDHSVSYHHNRRVEEFLNASFSYLPAINDSRSWPWGTTAYTSLVRLDDQRAMIAYDMEQPIFASFSMEIELARG
jgi:hypothetical protein